MQTERKVLIEFQTGINVIVTFDYNQLMKTIGLVLTFVLLFSSINAQDKEWEMDWNGDLQSALATITQGANDQGQTASAMTREATARPTEAEFAAAVPQGTPQAMMMPTETSAPSVGGLTTSLRMPWRPWRPRWRRRLHCVVYWWPWKICCWFVWWWFW